MSLTYLSTTISNPSNGKSKTRNMLVDSGSTYSIVPTKILEEIYVKPIDKQMFILANGKTLECSIGEVRFTILGKQRISPVVFGDKDVWVIGATTLENMGFALDPINRQLLHLPLNV